jgi:hypothetical protein
VVEMGINQSREVEYFRRGENEHRLLTDKAFTTFSFALE